MRVRNANFLLDGHCNDILAEWLTRCPAKALSSGRAGSNPADVVLVYFEVFGNLIKLPKNILCKCAVVYFFVNHVQLIFFWFWFFFWVLPSSNKLGIVLHEGSIMFS